MEQHTPVATTESILLIADDLLFPSRVREGVRPFGYPVQVAATETDALRQLENAPLPGFILIHLNARRFDAFRLIARIKASPSLVAIPLLAFAGHTETEKHQAARTAGADYVLANSSVSLHLTKVLERITRSSTREPIEDVL